jgi:hypothetical protein
MTEQADHTRTTATNIIAFVPRRKRPKVGIAIRADFKLEEVPFDSFLGAATNCSARDMTQENANGVEHPP